jgi:transglutaminase-like putative cysteine protease
MIFDISHKTTYQYSSPVVQSQHLVHMSPRSAPGQIVHQHELSVDPAPAVRQHWVDAFGNSVVILDMEVPHREFVLRARSTVETTPPPPIDFARSVAWDQLDTVVSAHTGTPDLDVVQFRCGSRLTMATLEIADYAEVSFAPRRPVLEATMDLVLRIYDEFTFDPKATDISTPIAQVLKQRRGVCQDFAHLAIACLRAQRVPARYVSGYILTKPPPGQARLLGTDASHAWISVWSPDTGWVDFDPTNGMFVADEHITIAYGRDYDDVSPISGVLIGGGEHTVEVGVDVVARQ